MLQQKMRPRSLLALQGQIQPKFLSQYNGKMMFSCKNHILLVGIVYFLLWCSKLQFIQASSEVTTITKHLTEEAGQVVIKNEAVEEISSHQYDSFFLEERKSSRELLGEGEDDEVGSEDFAPRQTRNRGRTSRYQRTSG